MSALGDIVKTMTAGAKKKNRKAKATSSRSTPPSPPTPVGLLRDELQLNQVRLPRVRDLSEDQLLSELLYALSPPVHEERQPSYGAIITEDRFVGHLVPKPILDVDGSGPAATFAANGTTSFIHLSPRHRRLVVFPTYMGGEAALAALATELRAIVVQRDPSGVVRVFSEHRIDVSKGRTWWRKDGPYRLHSNLNAHLPAVDGRILRELLNLAVHVLSPANCGATLIWWLAPPIAAVTGGKTLDLTPLKLCLEPEHFPVIHNILSQHDGATFVEPSGELLSTGIHLQSTTRAQAIIPQVRGTRHTSARRYSFDEPRVVVVTVSQDGPVTVFSDGAILGEVQAYSAEQDAANLAEMAPVKAPDIESDSWEETCRSCGKMMIVEEVVVYGWKETETANCQVCGEQVASRRCFRLEARVVKKF